MADGEIVEGWTRARGKGMGEGWKKGRKKKHLWIRAESDIKYIRIFSRDSRRRHGRSESWISFWWVFPFRLLLHFSPPRKPTVQSQPLNTNVNAFGFCGFFTPAFCPSSRSPSCPLGQNFMDASEALLEKGRARCGFFEGASSIAKEIEIFVSYVFRPTVALLSCA